jgi:glycosyltransferase involved in cell wall biosynthesis
MSPQTLRIAFATPEYVTENYFDGGLAHYIHRVAKALARMGHDVHVLTLSEIDRAEFEHEGVTVHRIKISRAWQPLNQVTRYRLAATTRFLDFSVQVYRKLRQLNAEQPLHLAQFPNCSCCGLVSMFLLRAPQVLRASSYRPLYHDLAGVKRNLDSWMVERMEALQWRLSRNIFAPSDHLKQLLAKEAGVDHVRVIRTPFYMETDDWDYSVYDQFLRGKKYLLFFGRFRVLKGIHILAQALPRVLEHHPDMTAALVGRDMESALAPSMADYARSLCGDSAERLTLIERLPHSQLYPVIAGAHLVVMPSLIDNLPNACLEAMALGKPVIGTLDASFDELISDGETGFLVPPNNVEALTEKIIGAWTDPRLPEIGQAAQQKILEFSPEKTVESLLSYYQEVLRGGASERHEQRTALPDKSFEPTAP